MAQNRNGSPRLVLDVMRPAWGLIFIMNKGPADRCRIETVFKNSDDFVIKAKQFVYQDDMSNKP